MDRLWDPPLETLQNSNIEEKFKSVLNFLDANLSAKWEFYVKPSLDGLNPDIILLNEEIGIQIIDFKHTEMNPIARLWNSKEEILNYYIPQASNERLRTELITTCFADPFSQKSDILTKIDTWSTFLRRSPEESNYFSIISKEDLANKDLEETIKRVVPFSDFPRSKYMTKEIADSLRHHLRISDFILEDLEPLKVNTLSDQQQNLILTRSQTGYRRIRGSSGSGKSLVLAGKAVDLYKQGKSVLFLCYNKTLVNLVKGYYQRFLKGDEELEFMIKRGGNEFHEPHFMHYHRYAKRLFKQSGHHLAWGEFFSSKNSDDRVGEGTIKMSQALHDLIKGLSAMKYDAILIDEGQDFHPEWWRAVRQLIRDNGEAYFVIDEAQDLYDNNKNWNNDIMKNSGFSGRPTLLKSSYRLPKSYIPFMQDFMKIYKPDPLGMEGLLKPEQPLQLELGGLENTYISWEKIKEGDEDVARQDGVHRCVNLVSDILPKVVEDFSYNDITLLCSTQKTGIQIVNILEQKGIGCAHIFPDDPDDPDDYKIEDVRKMKFTLTKEKLKISTVHSFKGFESPLILYFLENKTPFEEAYTALTRLRLSQKNNSHIKVVCVDPKYDRYGETWGPTKGSEWLELK